MKRLPAILIASGLAAGFGYSMLPKSETKVPTDWEHCQPYSADDGDGANDVLNGAGLAYAERTGRDPFTFTGYNDNSGWVHKALGGATLHRGQEFTVCFETNGTVHSVTDQNVLPSPTPTTTPQN